MRPFMTVCDWARIYDQKHGIITRSYDGVDIFCLCNLTAGHYRDEDKGNIVNIEIIRVAPKT